MPISDTVRLGENVSIVQPSLVNLYGCTIGDETKIGAFVEIQKKAVVGADCKISSHSFICEGVVIDDEVFVGHGVMFTNDRYPRATNRDGVVADRSRLEGRTDPSQARGVDRIQRHDHLWSDDRRRCAGRRGSGREQRCSGLRDCCGRAGARDR